MNKRRYYQLVYYDIGWNHYAIHEALYDRDTDETYWVGSKPVRIFDTYNPAIEYWSNIEPMSAIVDILNFSEISELFDKVDYSDEEELNFDE